MTFRERKAARTDHYIRFKHGWRARKCAACNGSGRYDHDGSPACGACEGTGKEWYKHVTGPVKGDHGGVF